MLMAAIFNFTVGSLVAGTAKQFSGLLLGRCIQGTGGGGIAVLTYVIATDMVALAERAKWSGLISLQWAVGSVVGPIVGGLIIQKSTWRWIFWLNLPFCALALITVPVCLQQDPGLWISLQELRCFDWTGSIIFVTSTTSLLLPLTWGKISITNSNMHFITAEKFRRCLVSLGRWADDCAPCCWLARYHILCWTLEISRASTTHKARCVYYWYGQKYVLRNRHPWNDIVVVTILYASVLRNRQALWACNHRS